MPWLFSRHFTVAPVTLQTEDVYAAPNNSPSKIARNVQTKYFPDADQTSPLIVLITVNPAAGPVQSQVRAADEPSLHNYPQPFRAVI